jgi:predicted RNase H-like HicB family nuclease
MVQIPYTSQLYEEDEQYVAVCPELNVSSFGGTPAEALASLKEAVSLFLEECQRMGTLTFVLEEAGYQRDPIKPNQWIHREPIQINRLEASFA